MTTYRLSGELLNVFNQQVNYCKADIEGIKELNRWLVFFTESAFFVKYHLNVSVLINNRWIDLENICGGYRGTETTADNN